MTTVFGFMKVTSYLDKNDVSAAMRTKTLWEQIQDRWEEFRLPTWGVIKKAMKQPVVLDGRNIYDGDELQEMGFVYHCIGR